jgi:hypothetical protein
MAVTDVKFSNFADGGDLEVNDIVVGLRNGVNTRFDFNGAPGLYLPLLGGTMAGAIDMDGNSITGLPSPTFATDAVNKAYADSLVAGAAMTRVDDTNVTLTLGGTPTTALLDAVSLTLGWTGTLSGTRGGTGVNNGSSTITIGGNFAMIGAFTFDGTLTGNTAVTFPTSGTLATTSQLPTPAALTRVDDTNVTLTLGGTPATSLWQAVSLTLGWTGQLGLTRGGTNASLTASNGGIVYSTASALAILAGTPTAGQIVRSGLSGAPSWSTATYPDAAGAIGNVLKSDGTNWISAADTPGALTQNHILVGNASNVAADVAMSGDATIVASGALTIANSAVTNAKMANMNDQTIKGNVSGGAAAPSDLTKAQVLTMLSSPFNSVNVQRVTATGAGTYTPTTGMKYVIVQAQAAGGGGGGAAAAAAGQGASAAGGGGGEYIQALFTASQIGASKAYSVGAKGAGGTAGANNGTAGGNTTFNTTWIVTNGGGAGNGRTSTASLGIIQPTAGTGGNGGSVATGTLIDQNAGCFGQFSMQIALANSISGSGGSAGDGSAGGIFVISSSAAGTNAPVNSGAGGAGASSNNGAAAAGGDGGDGYINFIEFISV